MSLSAASTDSVGSVISIVALRWGTGAGGGGVA